MSTRDKSDQVSVRKAIRKKRNQKKYNLPVIGHFPEGSIEFNSILQAEAVTGIHYTLIFEACVGKIYKAKNIRWEYKKGNHYIRYKAFYINHLEKYIGEEIDE